METVVEEIKKSAGVDELERGSVVTSSNTARADEEPDPETALKQEQDDEIVPWTLETLPTEMFLHICSFIDAGFLLRRMTLVCKQFYNILSNEQTWKIRQTKRWRKNGVYPPVAVNEHEFPWSRSCVKREEQIKLWGNDGSNLRNVELRGHIACVDAVHLFEGGRYLASGSRDRSIIIWDVEKCFNEKEPAMNSDAGGPKIETKVGAHRGWIWSLTSNSSHLLSASWDTTVRIWDRKCDFQLVTEFPTRVACLSLGALDNLVACGTFDAKVLLFDPRKGYEPITWYTAHKKAVLELAMDEDRIITCGEDGKVVSYDSRMRKVLKTFTLPGNTYPTCLSFRADDPAPHFYVGDKSGGLHLIDSTNFSIVHSYDIGHSQSIQGVFHSMGSVFTCSRDGKMKIFEPSSGLVPIASYSLDEELPDVHSLYNTVALAGADGMVRLWSPVEGF